MYSQPYLRFRGGLLGVGFAPETLRVSCRLAADIEQQAPLFQELVVETPGFRPERGLRARLQLACLDRVFELLAQDYAPALAATLSFGTVETRFDDVMTVLGDNARRCGRLALILRGDLCRMQQPRCLRHVADAAQENGAMLVLRGELHGNEGVRAVVTPDLLTLDALPGGDQRKWGHLAAWLNRRGIPSDAILFEHVNDADQLQAALHAGFVYAQGEAVGVAHEAPRLEAFAPRKRPEQRRQLAA